VDKVQREYCAAVQITEDTGFFIDRAEVRPSLEVVIVGALAMSAPLVVPGY
jgi:hypothetical protein